VLAAESSSRDKPEAAGIAHPGHLSDGMLVCGSLITFFVILHCVWLSFADSSVDFCQFHIFQILLLSYS